MNTRRLTRTDRTHLITSLCVSVFLVSICVYVYFLSFSVVQVVLQQEAEQEIQYLRSEIAELERSYIEAQHVVSARIATEHELVANQDKIFIHRDAGSLVLAPAAQ